MNNILLDFPRENQHKLKNDFLIDLLPKVSQGAGYLTCKRSVNNEIRFIFNRRLPGRKPTETIENRKLEQKSKLLENQIYKLNQELIDKENQLLNIRRKYETSGDKSDWEKLAVINLEIRDINRTLHGEHSELFRPVSASILGITNDLQESIKSPVSLLSDSFLNLNKINFLVAIETINFLAGQLTKLFNKDKFQDGNKPTKLGPYARHRFLETGAILEKYCGNDNLIFTTFTVPGRSDESKKAIADYSSWVVNNLIQVFRDYHNKYNGSYINYCFSWEPHLDGMLHLHLVWGSAVITDEQLDYLSNQLSSKWERILDQFATQKIVSRGNKRSSLPAVDMYARNYNDIHHKNRKRYKHIESWADHKKELWELGRFVVHEKVTKSAAAYLSKYASKENYKLNKGVTLNYPARWWGCDAQSLVLAKCERIEFTCTIDDYIYELIFDFLAICQDSLNYYHNKFWDIYNVIVLGGKSTRVNRKPWEARPANSIRVSAGALLVCYFHKNKFEAVSDILKYICDYVQNCNLGKSAIIPGKKFLSKSELLEYENLKNEGESINQIIARNYKAYWRNITFSS